MNHSRKKEATYGVTLQPRTYQSMLKGVEKLAAIIRPTLGPFPRMVAFSSSLAGRPPDLLDDGGLIARRLVQLPDRDEDVGAMYLRHLVWRVREACGDGTATTAVLFEEILRQGVRHIVSGGHAMPLRYALEKAARLLHAELGKMAQPAQERASATRIAESICPDQPMANMLGEIFDRIGEYGFLEFRTGQGRGLDFEYTEGTYWEGPLHSALMLNRPLEGKAVLENAAVLVTDFAISDPHDLVRAIVEAKKAGKTSLFLLCNSITESCIGFLMADTTRSALPVIAVKTPSVRIEEQMGAMEDLAVLTGATAMTLHAGETLEGVAAHHFGQARSVWANNQFFGIQGGQGDPRKIRQHFAALKKLHAHLENGESRTIVRARIGKMMGGSATLFTGGAAESEMTARKDLAERSAEAIRGAMTRGLLPGGGAAFLACKPALSQLLQQASDPDEIAAYKILFKAMDLPLRVIAANAGLNPDEVLAEVRLAGAGHGYDVRSQKVFQTSASEIFDSASVIQGVAFHSIAGAALLLTVDVLLHHKNPETVVEP